MSGDRSRTAVLFDIGAVLLKLDFNGFFEEAKAIAPHADISRFRKEYFLIEKKTMTGEACPADYLEEVRQALSLSEELPYRRLLSAMWKGPAQDVVAVKRAIAQAGYTVGLFSNTSRIAIEVLHQECPEIFVGHTPESPIIYSFDVGAVKSQPDMYERVKLRGFEKVVYIDDNSLYVRIAAEQFGWHGIWLTPFIDRAEPIRAVHNAEELPSKNFKKADSVDELAAALRGFGIEF